MRKDKADIRNEGFTATSAPLSFNLEMQMDSWKSKWFHGSPITAT